MGIGLRARPPLFSFRSFWRAFIRRVVRLFLVASKVRSQSESLSGLFAKSPAASVAAFAAFSALTSISRWELRLFFLTAIDKLSGVREDADAGARLLVTVVIGDNDVDGPGRMRRSRACNGRLACH